MLTAGSPPNDGTGMKGKAAIGSTLCLNERYEQCISTADDEDQSHTANRDHPSSVGKVWQIPEVLDVVNRGHLHRILTYVGGPWHHHGLL